MAADCAPSLFHFPHAVGLIHLIGHQICQGWSPSQSNSCYLSAVDLSSSGTDDSAVAARRNPVLVEFGRRVRELRDRRGWSQELLAEKAGVHRTYVGGIERGLRNVALVNIARIAKAFGLTLSDLFAD